MATTSKKSKGKIKPSKAKSGVENAAKNVKAAENVAATVTEIPQQPAADPAPKSEPAPKPERPTKEEGIPKVQFTSTKRLHRSSDSIIGGVCAGIAEYIEVDPILVRLAFIALTMAGGAGVFLYIALWILIPEDDGVAGVSSSEMINEESIRKNTADVVSKGNDIWESVKEGSKQGNARTVFGLIAVFLGCYFWLENMGLLGWFDFGDIWPVILVGIGAVLLLKKK
ncbi:MAG: PspC domain-containing protein [Candidatus Dojkabacteria bacterium]|nr:MAG: PspC domain-containing protein [Candidatus Dojkabacteria bacterium]